MPLIDFILVQPLQCLALAFAVMGYFQAVKIIKARIYVEYTKRFTEIEAEIHALFSGLRPELDTPAKIRAASYIAGMKYLNLCSEEYHLRTRGLVDRDVWGYWSSGIPKFLNLPGFKELAEEMVADFKPYYPKFHKVLVQKLNEVSRD